MASRVALAYVTWLSYDICGLKYDASHNRGIGAVLFASICTMIADHHEWTATPEHDTIFALSLVLWPGCLWGLTLFLLFSAAKDEIACFWLITSPLIVILPSLPILAKYATGRDALRNLRLVTGLVAIGILTGHFLSRSSLVRSINQHIHGYTYPLMAFLDFTAIAGATIMLVSVSGMAQSYSGAMEHLRLTRRMPNDSTTVLSLPPGWGIQKPSCVVKWMIGLALGVSTLEDARARAALVSTSVAIVLTMAYVPAFSGKIFGRSYDDHIRLLSILQVATVVIYFLYHTLIQGTMESRH